MGASTSSRRLHVGEPSPSREGGAGGAGGSSAVQIRAQASSRWRRAATATARLPRARLLLSPPSLPPPSTARPSRLSLSGGRPAQAESRAARRLLDLLPCLWCRRHLLPQIQIRRPRAPSPFGGGGAGAGGRGEPDAGALLGWRFGRTAIASGPGGEVAHDLYLSRFGGNRGILNFTVCDALPAAAIFLLKRFSSIDGERDRVPSANSLRVLPPNKSAGPFSNLRVCVHTKYRCIYICRKF
jgi:hypothetical protein